ncbi:MAG: formyltransferase family protein [Planctomycetota bacterium]|nr:formyltransferase family protein [Planctomycetota bacterium]
MNDVLAQANVTTQTPLRLVFITEDDPLYVIRFFDVFFDEYPRDEFEVVAITVAEAFHEPLWKTAWRMLRFYGPLDFVRLAWRFVGVKLSRRSIAKLATMAQVPVIRATSINDPAYVERIRDLDPDVIVSVAAPEIFKKEILASARNRCINIHSGRLPKYRGMMPNFWQLLHGESHATVTVHEMAAKLDAGDVLGTQEFPLKDRDVLDRVIVGTKQEGARLMIKVLRQLAAGTDQPKPLNMDEAEYYSFPTPDDVRKLRKRGHRML